MKKVAVIGLYAIKNAGDNILCEATLYLLQRSEVQIFHFFIAFSS